MSRGVGYDPCDVEPTFIQQAKNVDEAPRGLGKLVAAAVAALETSVARPSHTTHDDVLRANSGWALDPVVWAQRQAATRTLEAQTARLADALAAAGVDVVLPGDVTMIGAVTGIVERQRVYRACRFLPTVAARDRRPIVNGLKLWMSGHRSARYFRYAVMTSPEPVPVGGDLRGAIQTLSRRISRWAHKVKEEYAVQVLYRGIEFTRATAAERDAEAHANGRASDLAKTYGADTVLYHVHANTLYWPTHVLRPAEWKAFLQDTHAATGAWWRDNGRIGKIEELVKYCSKPQDTMRAPDDELVWLYQQTQRLHLCQPLGDFASWLRELADAGEKIVRVHVGHGDGRLMRVQKRQKAAGDAAADSTASDRDDESDDAAAATDRERREPPANVILGLTLPQWRHTPWAEPMILVQHYDPLRLSDEAGCGIREWQRQAREWWDGNWGPEPEEAMRVARMALDAQCSSDDIREAAEAAPFIVHTCSLTVPEADEELPPEECSALDAELAALLGGVVIRLRPRPVTDDDDIPYEDPLRAAYWATLRADLAASESRWAEWRASAASGPGQYRDQSCRIAA